MRLSIEAIRGQLDRWQMTYIVYDLPSPYRLTEKYNLHNRNLSVIFVEDRGLLKGLQYVYRILLQCTIITKTVMKQRDIIERVVGTFFRVLI